ncbi:MAG: diacylglycerol kinase family protein [Bryobacteraceae bacterium]
MQKGNQARRSGTCSAAQADLREFFQALAAIPAQALPDVVASVAVACATAPLLRRAMPLVGRKFDIDDESIQMSAHFWYCDSSKASRKLGFVTRDPKETLRDTVAYLQAHAHDEDGSHRPSPHSASGKTGKLWDDLAPRLGGIDTRFTSAPNHATALARELLSAGYERIVSVGGDGTVNEVVNGFFDEANPCGRARCWRCFRSEPAATFSEAWASATSRTLSSWCVATRPRAKPTSMCIRYVAHEGGERERYFANVVSFGMGGEVATGAKNFLKAVGGKVAFIYSTFRVFFSYSAKTASITLDGRDIGSHTITNVAIGNGRYHGGGMHVCPRALLDDGELEVTVIDRLSMFELARDLHVLYSENLYKHPKTHHFRARHFRAESYERVGRSGWRGARHVAFRDHDRSQGAPRGALNQTCFVFSRPGGRARS